jgi:hypothetical protein
MPIGPITPGTYVAVTPDASPAAYTSIQAPTATMPVIGADIQELTLALLNVQQRVIDRYLDKILGGTIAGPLVVTDTVDFQATGADRPAFQGGLRVVAGGIAVTAGDLSLSNGSASISNDLTVGDDALIAGDLQVGQALQLNQFVISTDADQHIDGSAPFVKLPFSVFNSNHLGIMDAAPDGRFVKIVSWENGYLLTLTQSDGTTAILDAQGNAIKLTATNSPGAGEHESVTLYRAGGAWEYAGA